ncbi:MAG: hypothetical protein IJ615_05915 [Bacteroidaceae bacterium]|nr:hypothetical protein [Bacteroidaceae bacterium]
MKKTYIYPTTEIQAAEAAAFIALSLLDGNATGDDALVKSDDDWSIWSDEDTKDN